MDKKRKKSAAAKGADLKRYFVPLGSGNNSKPSIHQESANFIAQEDQVQEMEGGTRNSSKPSTNESIDVSQEQEQEVEGGLGNSMDTNMERVEDSAETIVEENVVVLEAGGITDFIEYIKLDPGLRIQIDEFASNVREDVRFAYLKNGPTQPTQHNFPINRDKRSFLPKWYKKYDWLEYSVDKDKAYCFYCYLFKHIGHENFGHDVFNKLGFNNWKNATDAFRKHVGGPCSIHNMSRTACDDFKNQKHVSEELPSRYVLPEQHRHGGIPAGEAMPEPLPVVDIGRLPATDEASKLRVALESWGLFLATNHGIEVSLLDALMDGAREFFHQPLETRQKFSNLVDGTPRHKGYGCLLSQDQTIDWFDRVHLAIDPEDERDLSSWPQFFRGAMLEYAGESKKIRDRVLRAIATLLELEEDHFVSKVTDRAITFAAVNYYPPCPAPDRVFGFRPHSDGRLITFLLADKDIGGLQVRKDGRWYNVPTKPGSLLVFVGDSLEIMSNGAFKAAVHRVVTNPVKDRISVAMFFGVDGDTVLEPAPALLDETRPARYRKMRTKEYIQGILEHYSLYERMIETMKI